jgi:hypothetical protein
VNLRVAQGTLEGRHSAFAVGNYLRKFRVGPLLNCVGAKIRNVQALSSFGASAVWTMTHGAFRSESRLGGRAALTRVCPHNRGRKKYYFGHEYDQNRAAANYRISTHPYCHNFLLPSKFPVPTALCFCVKVQLKP